MALELAAAQGGEIGEQLKGLLLACTGVAYHHAGAPLAVRQRVGYVLQLLAPQKRVQTVQMKRTHT